MSGQEPAPTLSQQLAAYVTGSRYEAFSPELIAKTKQVILDTIGCMAAGSRDDVGRMIAAHVLREGPPGPCTVFGHPQRVGPAYAGLANGTTAHALELDDGHRPSGNHQGCAVVPAALAMAEATKASGRDVLSAVILGYDVEGRVGEAVCLPRNATPFHGNGTVGCFGTATAAGHLQGLDTEQLADALGIAGDGASGLREFPRPNGADCKPLHVGRAVQTGIVAAQLAAGGFHGPDTILEGKAGFCAAMTPQPRLELIVRDLGERFAVMESGFKVYACIGNHTPIEAALWLRRTHAINPDTITHVRIGLPKAGRIEHYSQKHPQNVSSARFSLSFIIASALLYGEVSQRQMSRAGLADSRVAALEDKTELVHDQEAEEAYAEQDPEAPFLFIPSSVDIETAGAHYRRIERTPSGYDPNSRGLSQEELVAKFHWVVRDVLTTHSAERVVNWVMGLDAQSRIEDLAGLFEYVPDA